MNYLGQPGAINAVTPQVFYNMIQEVFSAAGSSTAYDIKERQISSVISKHPANIGAGFRMGTNRISIDVPFPVNVNGTTMDTVIKMPFQGSQGYIDNMLEIQLTRQLNGLGIIAPTTRQLSNGHSGIIEQRRTKRIESYSELKANWNLYLDFIRRCDTAGVILRDASPSKFCNLGILDGKIVSHDYAYFRYTGRQLICPKCNSGLLNYNVIDDANNRMEGYKCSNMHCQANEAAGGSMSLVTVDDLIVSMGVK